MSWGPIRFPDYSLSQFQQPKQNHSFVVLYQLPKGLKDQNIEGFKTEDGQGFMEKVLGRGTNPSQSMLYNIEDLSDFLTLSTTSIGDVTWNVNQKVDENFFNGHVISQGRRTFSNNLTVSFREYTTSPIQRAMNYWQRLQNDSVTHNIGYMQNYKGLIVKLELDPNVFFDGTDQVSIETLLGKIKNETQQGLEDLNNVITRQLVFDGVWPTSIPEPGANYSSDDNVTLNINFSIDRYYDDVDWRRFLGQTDTNISSIVAPNA